MPYAPTVNDQSGQILAAGINQGIAGLSKGIDEYMRKKDEKEKQEQAFALLRAASDAAIPDDALRAGIKGLGGAGAFQVAQQVSQQKRQADLDKQTAMLNAAHLKGINDAAEQLARDRNAVTQAFNPAGNLAPAIQGGASFEQLPAAAPQDMSSMVMQAARNGASPQTLSHLANMADNLAQAQQRATPKSSPMPIETKFGGVPAVVANGNVQFVPNHSPKPEFPRVVEINGVPHTQVSASQFVKPDGTLLSSTGEKPATTGNITAAMMAAGVISDTQNWLKENPKAGLMQRQSTYDAEALRRKAAANAAAQAIGEQPPFPEAMREKGVKPLTGKPSTGPSPASSRFRIIEESK